ncbi:MAG: peptide chain release factor N(5)-glutamine methyltransferase [Candidatus Omnitrophota bacterium]
MNELELILSDILHCSRTDLYLNSNLITFKDKEFKTLDRILRERSRVKPIQYILGHTEFMGLRFNIREGVLIPRPETEILVEVAIEEISKIRNRKSTLKILDIGTGSGCIAIALAKSLDNVDIVAVDISQDAMNLAKENTRLQKLEDRIKFIRSDLFNHKFFKTFPKFDIIVSNPPYVPTAEIGMFDYTVKKEPRLALDGGRDGLDFYRRINKDSQRFLKKNGLLFLELGDRQSDKISGIFSQGWRIEKFIKDYQGLQRICIIRKSNEDTIYEM